MNNANKILGSDISKEKKLQAEIRSAKEFAEDVIKYNPYSIQVFDASGQSISVNKAWEELWQRPAEMTVHYNILKDEQLKEQKIHDLLERAFKGERFALPTISYQNPETVEQIGKSSTFVSKADTHYISANIFPVFDDQGKVRNVILMHNDITKQKLLEIKLQETIQGLENTVQERTKDLKERVDELENAKKAVLNVLEDLKEKDNVLEVEKNKLQITLESIGDGAFVVSSENKIIFFNKVAEELSGYSRKEAVGKEYKEVLKFVLEKDGKENYSFIEKAFKFGKIYHITNHTLLISKAGKEIPILDSAAPIKDSRGQVTGVIVVFRDITKEQAMEKARRDFISLSSHQLRTPLTSIKWMADMFLKGDLGKLTNQQKEFMGNLYESANRMAELITALLNIARIESAQLQVNSEVIDPEKLYQNVAKELQVLSEAKGHQIIFKKDKDLPEFKSDPQLFFEIFKNLLSNAIKYTPNKGKIEVFFSAKGKNMLFSVKDNGFGIPKQQQERVFQKFFRADNIVKLVTEGTGLGTYIVQQLVRLLEGKIWFESEENKGTVFYVSLPVSGPKVKRGTKEIAS